MGAENSNGMHVAILYDLLSRDEKLDNAEVKALQDILNETGHPVGVADAIVGKNTAAGIISFLQDPEHQLFAAQIGASMEKILHRHGQGEAITRLKMQANLDDSIKQDSTAEINRLIHEEGLSEASVVELQENLENLGYELGNVDGDFGKKTSAALIDYMRDNPEALIQTDPSILQRMMQKGQASNLREIAADNQDFQDRIKDKLHDLGASDDPSVLLSSLDYDGIRDLQTLLSVAGHRPGGIDGIVGSKTIAAAQRYINENTPDPTAPAGPDIESEAIKQAPIIMGSDTPKTPDDGESNGYGVPSAAVEKAWGRITGEQGYSDVAIQVTSNPRPLIVIDLGHGSDINSNDKIDPGAVSPHIEDLSEVSVVDPVSAEMARQLHEMGYEVALTREPGEQLRVEGSHAQTLRVRPEFAHHLANEMNANGVIFVSMHANSFAKESANGTRLYIDVDGAHITNDDSSNLANSISETFAVSAKGTAVKHVGDLSVIDRFENGLDKADGISAGILVELGFLSNKKDAEALAHMRDNPAQAAAQITEGINDYIISKRPELAAPKEVEVTKSSDMSYGM